MDFLSSAFPSPNDGFRLEFGMRVFRPNNHADSIEGESGSADPEIAISVCPAQLTAAASNARRRPRKHSGSPWPHPFTKKCGLVPMRVRARWSQLFAGSGQGRMTSSFKAMYRSPRRSDPFNHVGLACLPTRTCGLPASGVPVLRVLGPRDDIAASQLGLRVRLRPGMFLSRSKWQ